MNIFLTLTSFLLTKSLLGKNRETIKVGGMIKHRLARIYPAYILIVLFCVAVYILRTRSIPADFIPLILTSQNFWWLYDGYANATPMTGHLWYITLDIYLFVVWIIAMRFIPRSKLFLFFCSCIVLAVLWRTVCVLSGASIMLSYMIPVGVIDSFALGGLIALGYSDSYSVRNTYPYLCLLIGVFGIGLCLLVSAYVNNLTLTDAFLSYSTSKGYSGNIFTVNVFLFVSLVGAGLILLCLKAPRMTFLSNKIMVEVGGMTYLLYLVHFPILIITSHILNEWYLIALMTFFMSLITAYIYLKVFSTPIDRILRRLTVG